MAATDAKAFPVRNAAYRVYGRAVAISTGNPITGGLTGLATSGNSQVSKDGGAFADTTNAPTEIGTSGYFALDLTASEMDADAVQVRVLATNSGAVEFGQLMLTSGTTQGLTVGGYASGQDPATLILATPANKLGVDATGRVTATGTTSAGSLQRV